MLRFLPWKFIVQRTSDFDPWDRLQGRLEIEWTLLREKTAALAALAGETAATKGRLE